MLPDPIIAHMERAFGKLEEADNALRQAVERAETLTDRWGEKAPAELAALRAKVQRTRNAVQLATERARVAESVRVIAEVEQAINQEPEDD